MEWVLLETPYRDTCKQAKPKNTYWSEKKHYSFHHKIRTREISEVLKKDKVGKVQKDNWTKWHTNWGWKYVWEVEIQWLARFFNRNFETKKYQICVDVTLQFLHKRTKWYPKSQKKKIKADRPYNKITIKL